MHTEKTIVATNTADYNEAQVVEDNLKIDELQKARIIELSSKAVITTTESDWYKSWLADNKTILDEICDSTGRHLLHLACFPNIGTIQLHALLEHGANPNIKDRFSDTPLHYAADVGSLFKIKALLEHGADKNLNNCDGQTPMDLAAEVGNTTAIQALLEKPVKRSEIICSRYKTIRAAAPTNPKANSTSKKTPWRQRSYITRQLLLEGIQEGNLEKVKLGVANEKNISIQDTDGNGLLNIIINHIQDKDLCANIVNIVLNTGKANVNQIGSAGKTPLDLAARKRNARVCELLLTHGADPSFGFEEGKRVIDQIKETGGVVFWRLFLEILGVTFIKAIEKADEKRIDELMLGGVSLEIQVNVEVQGVIKRLKVIDVIHAKKGDAFVSKLLEKQRSLNERAVVQARKKQEQANFLLWDAALDGSVLGIQNAMANGAQVNAVNYREETALHIAVYYIEDHASCYKTTEELLKIKGIDVDAKDDYNNTALGLAGIDGKIDVLRLLLSHGADPSLGSNRKTRPIDRLHENNHHEAKEQFATILNLSLMQAVLNGNKNRAKQLVFGGADINTKVKLDEVLLDQSALDLAKLSGNDEFVLALEVMQQGVDVDEFEEKPNSYSNSSSCNTSNITAVTASTSISSTKPITRTEWITHPLVFESTNKKPCSVGKLDSIEPAPFRLNLQNVFIKLDSNIEPEEIKVIKGIVDKLEPTSISLQSGTLLCHPSSMKFLTYKCLDLALNEIHINQTSNIKLFLISPEVEVRHI
ncbi:MAG: ankyrin repeat domain-containing protein [Proteobacteria bacterium]|nr:ankyrin repeat domain-containing protein [Pseudomonadota bacterium]